MREMIEQGSKVDPNVERLVCNIIKEAIINAISAKKCKSVAIKLLLEDNHISLSMENCGVEIGSQNDNKKEESYEIISSFGGKIKVEHFKDRGTVVSLRIPSFIHI